MVEYIVFFALGWVLLIVTYTLFGNEIPDVELPMLGRVPIVLCVAVGLAFYGSLGLVVIGVGQGLLGGGFQVSAGLSWVLVVISAAVSIRFGRFLQHMFPETPFDAQPQDFFGMNATVRFSPTAARSGDALIMSRGTNQFISVAVHPEAVEKVLPRGTKVTIVDFDENKRVYLIVRAEGNDFYRLFHG